MALSINTLETAIREFLDPDYTGFRGYPNSSSIAAQEWANALGEYTASIVPVSVTQQAAISAFITTASPITSTPPTGIALLTAAFTSYATTLASGMQPAFTSTPPTTPIPIAAIVPIGLSGVSGREVAISLSSIIDSWFRTGVAVNNSSGATIIWN